MNEFIANMVNLYLIALLYHFFYLGLA